MQGQTALHSAAAQDWGKRFNHTLKFQDSKYQYFLGFRETGVYDHLKHISLQYEQTVDTLVAHGADLFAQDDQVGHAAGTEL